MTTLRSLARHLALEGNIRVLALQTLISQLGFGMFYVIWQPYVLSTGVSVVGLGIIQSIINLSTAVGLIFWGILSDQLGRKRVILVSNACRVIALIALMVSTNFAFLLVFAFFIGFSSLFMQANPARSALTSESVDSNRRATAFSTLLFFSQITNTLVASAGGYLAVTLGYHSIFYICVAGDLVGLLLLGIFLKETLKDPAKEDAAQSTASKLVDYLVPERSLAKLYLIMTVMGLGYGTTYSVFYGTLVDTYRFDPIQLGILSTSFNLTWGVTSIPLGRLSDRIGRLPLLKASWAAAFIAILGFLASRSFEMFLLFNMISALDTSFWLSAWMAYVAEKASSERLSTVMGKLESYVRWVGIPAPWLGGLLYSSYGFAAPLVVQAICLTASGALIFSLKEA